MDIDNMFITFSFIIITYLGVTRTHNHPTTDIYKDLLKIVARPVRPARPNNYKVKSFLARPTVAPRKSKKKISIVFHDSKHKSDLNSTPVSARTKEEKLALRAHNFDSADKNQSKINRLNDKIYSDEQNTKPVEDSPDNVSDNDDEKDKSVEEFIHLQGSGTGEWKNCVRYGRYCVNTFNRFGFQKRFVPRETSYIDVYFNSKNEKRNEALTDLKTKSSENSQKKPLRSIQDVSLPDNVHYENGNEYLNNNTGKPDLKPDENITPNMFNSTPDQPETFNITNVTLDLELEKYFVHDIIKNFKSLSKALKQEEIGNIDYPIDTFLKTGISNVSATLPVDSVNTDTTSSYTNMTSDNPVQQNVTFHQTPIHSKFSILWLTNTDSLNENTPDKVAHNNKYRNGKFKGNIEKYFSKVNRHLVSHRATTQIKSVTSDLQVGQAVEKNIDRNNNKDDMDIAPQETTPNNYQWNQDNVNDNAKIYLPSQDAKPQTINYQLYNGNIDFKSKTLRENMETITNLYGMTPYPFHKIVTNHLFSDRGNTQDNLEAKPQDKAVNDFIPNPGKQTLFNSEIEQYYATLLNHNEPITQNTEKPYRPTKRNDYNSWFHNLINESLYFEPASGYTEKYNTIFPEPSKKYIQFNNNNFYDAKTFLGNQRIHEDLKPDENYAGFAAPMLPFLSGITMGVPFAPNNLYPYNFLSTAGKDEFKLSYPRTIGPDLKKKQFIDVKNFFKKWVYKK